MSEPYGFWNPPEGPDGYPGDAVIDAANEAVDLRDEVRRLRLAVDLRDEVRRLRLALEEAADFACFNENRLGDPCPCCEFVVEHVNTVLSGRSPE